MVLVLVLVVGSAGIEHPKPETPFHVEGLLVLASRPKDIRSDLHNRNNQVTRDYLVFCIKIEYVLVVVNAE